MSYYDWPFIEYLETFLRANQIEQAITACETRLSEVPMTPFHQIIGKDLLHTKKRLATWLTDLNVEASFKLKKVEAIYSEMNGFSINPDLWFTTGVAFKKLEDYQTNNWKKERTFWYPSEFIVTGLEGLQDVFAFAYKEDSFRKKTEEAQYYCEYTIVLRLQQLFGETHKELKKNELGRIPIYVTAHDYSIIYEINKGNNVA